MGKNVFRRTNFWFYVIWGLTIFFLVCKVFGLGAIASWSWWWVFAPVWGPIALGIGLCIIGVILAELYCFLALFFEIIS